MPLFSVEGMTVEVQATDGFRTAVRDVRFAIDAGEVLALVGESASGKSLMAMGGLRLQTPGVRTVAGTVHFDGTDLGELTDDGWRRVVGTGIGVIFQDPIGAHDPLQAVGPQSGEVLAAHSDLEEDEIRQRVLDALGEVKLAARGKFVSFAHQMSRGEAQRAMVAAALLTKPKLLIADEPLTGLDVTVGRAVLDVIELLRTERNMAMLLVTHDMAVVAATADRVAVVYGGMIVEQGPIGDVFRRPQHPYTSGLLGSIPTLTSGRLRPIAGEAPDITTPAPGCRFAPRCEYATAACHDTVPEAEKIGSSQVRCIRASELSLEGVPA